MRAAFARLCKTLTLPDLHLHLYLDPYTDQQLAHSLLLLGVLFGVLPALALLLRSARRNNRSYSATAATAGVVFFHIFDALVRMVLFAGLGSSLSLIFPWRGSGSSNGAESDGDSTERPRSSHRKRTSVRKVSNGGMSEGDESEDDWLYYPGLVNISGTYCFLNSVLQAMASLSYLLPHIDAIQSKAVELDVPTPVVDALRDTLRALNTPKSSSFTLRPIPMINALSHPIPGRKSKLFSSREHQDAQELFQLVSECIKAEALAVEREAQRDRGLGFLTQGTGSSSSMEDIAAESADMDILTSVFDGLTANRRSCVVCGYTEAVMHFAIDSWQLSLPAGVALCSLEDSLADYIRLEVLTDCVCRKCSVVTTHARLKQEADKIAASLAGDGSAPPPTQSKKNRLRRARKLENRVKAMIDEGRLEDEVDGVKVEKVFSRASTKQVMIARPPRVLVLHLNRSVHYGGYAGRNPCRVIYPELLDLTPYTTSGQLSIHPSAPISTSPPLIPGPGFRSITPTQAAYSTPRVLYRLAAVVCHYGAHSYGHYVCFRRRPSSHSHSKLGSNKRKQYQLQQLPRAEPAVFAQPRMTCTYGCDCAACLKYGSVRPLPALPGSGRGWLRISDATVEECGIERVLAEGSGAFLLFYERVVIGAGTQTQMQMQEETAIGVPIMPLSSSERTLESKTSSLTQMQMSGLAGVPGFGFGAFPSASSFEFPGGAEKYAGPYLANGRHTPHSSEETVRPANGAESATASVDSLVEDPLNASSSTGAQSAASPISIYTPGLANGIGIVNGACWSGSGSGSGSSSSISVSTVSIGSVGSVTSRRSSSSLRPRVVRRTAAGRMYHDRAQTGTLETRHTLLDEQASEPGTMMRMRATSPASVPSSSSSTTTLSLPSSPAKLKSKPEMNGDAVHASHEVEEKTDVADKEGHDEGERFRSEGLANSFVKVDRETCEVSPREAFWLHGNVGEEEKPKPKLNGTAEPDVTILMGLSQSAKDLSMEEMAKVPVMLSSSTPNTPPHMPHKQLECHPHSSGGSPVSSAPTHPLSPSRAKSTVVNAASLMPSTSPSKLPLRTPIPIPIPSIPSVSSTPLSSSSSSMIMSSSPSSSAPASSSAPTPATARFPSPQPLSSSSSPSPPSSPPSSPPPSPPSPSSTPSMVPKLPPPVPVGDLPA